jgi:hypothetical protein
MRKSFLKEIIFSVNINHASIKKYMRLNSRLMGRREKPNKIMLLYNNI